MWKPGSKEKLPDPAFLWVYLPGSENNECNKNDF